MRPHISINVRDIERSVEFYERLFGVRPSKQTGAYAKFDLEDPPLNFAMQAPGKAISDVNHFGIEVDSSAEVVKWEKRLREEGLLEAVEKGVSCCYAVQDKVWVTDPDGNEWEVFTVLEQLPVTEEEKEASGCATACCA